MPCYFPATLEIFELLHLAISVGTLSQFPVNPREPKMSFLRELGIFLQSLYANAYRAGPGPLVEDHHAAAYHDPDEHPH